MRRHVGIDEDQQLGALLRDEVAVFQQHLPRLRQKVIDVTRVFADDLLADGLFGAVFRVVAHKAAALITHALIELGFQVFVGFKRPEMQADGLREIRKRIDGEVAEHAQPVQIPSVLPAEVQIVFDALDEGG